MRRHADRDPNSVLFDLDALMADDAEPDALPFEQTAVRAPTMVPLVPLVAAPPRRPEAIAVLTTIAVVLAGGLALAAVGGVAWSLSTGDTVETPIEARTTRIAAGDQPTTPPPREPTAEATVVAAEPAPAEPQATTTEPAEPKAAPPLRTENTRNAKTVKRPAPRRPRARADARRPQPPAPPPSAEDRPEPAAPGPPVVARSEKPESAVDEVDRMLGLLDREPTRATGDAPDPPPVRHTAIALPERLTRHQIMRAVQAINPRMRACPGAGRYAATLRIDPAGQVKTVKVEGEDAAARACVERTVRQMVFPRFAGDPMSVELPFRL